METLEPFIKNANLLKGGQLELFDAAISEVTSVIGKVSGVSIKEWYSEFGTTSMTGLSRVVNHLILEGLRGQRWELPWRYFDLASQQASFEAGKVFQAGNLELRVGLDFGSRHKQSSLAYLVRPSLLLGSNEKDSPPESAGILLAFTLETLSWGLWNSANSSFESLVAETQLAAPVMTATSCIIGIQPSADLKVSKNLDYGGLELELI